MKALPGAVLLFTTGILQEQVPHPLNYPAGMIRRACLRMISVP